MKIFVDIFWGSPLNWTMFFFNCVCVCAFVRGWVISSQLNVWCVFFTTANQLKTKELSTCIMKLKAFNLACLVGNSNTRINSRRWDRTYVIMAPITTPM